MSNPFTRYFYGLSEKSRLIVFFSSFEELNFSHIKELRISNLDAYVKFLPKELVVYVRDLIVDNKQSDLVFRFSSGRKYSAKDVENVLIRGHKIADREYKGRYEFIERIQEKS